MIAAMSLSVSSKTKLMPVRPKDSFNAIEKIVEQSLEDIRELMYS